jgi:hypothetical protein
MNVIQLQDMLRGLPDDRLKNELSQPTGSVPEYLVLSEVVRRDRLRESAASAPQSTVVQDVMGAMQPQQQPMAMASGGFISPSAAMGNAGVRGFAPEPPKQPSMFGASSVGPQMFTPNLTPQPPAPVTNNSTSTTVNIPQQPGFSEPEAQIDGGQESTPEDPGFYEQPEAHANGGIIGLSNGGGTRDVIISRLQGLGYTPAAIAAILGAAEAESSFNPKAKGAAGEVGIFQWRGSRLDDLKDFAASRGGDIYDPAIQTDFLDKELRTTEGRAGKILLSAQNPEDAAIGMMHYERPAGYKRDDPTRGHNWSGRLGAAQNYYNTLFDGQAPAASTSNTPTPDQEAGSPMMNPADLASGILSGGVMPDPKKRGIGSFFAELMSNKDAKGDFMDLGSSLFNKGQNKQQAPEAPGITRGDPSLALGIKGKTPEEILAEYRALRTGYMAHGGPVRMFEGGTPPSFVQLTPAEIIALTPAQQAEYFRAQAQFERGGFKSRHLTEGAAKANEAAARAKERADSVYREKIVRGDTGIYQPSIETQLEAARGLQESGIPEAAPESTTPPNIPPADNYMLESAASAEEAASKVRAAREESDRKALEIEKNKPTAFDDYLTAYKNSQAEIANMYREQADKESLREQEAGGLPFLLRQLGIGMIATGGPLGEGVRGGLQQAFSAREEQTQAARDRIRELQLKGKMTDVEAANELAKLRYQAEMDAQKAGREGLATQKDYLAQVDDIGRLISSREDAVDAAGGDISTDPVIKEYRAIQAEIMKKAGLSGTMSGGTAGYRYVPGQGAVPR